jgi:hypothetical protein
LLRTDRDSRFDATLYPFFDAKVRTPGVYVLDHYRGSSLGRDCATTTATRRRSKRRL